MSSAPIVFLEQFGLNSANMSLSRDAARSLTKRPILLTDYLTERATRSQTGV